ncbi:DUF3500 domain-containing protein [Pirellulales bacterium]|nr:DUF3500 domain-containing protein [Pirellulales bacterium]
MSIKKQLVDRRGFLLETGCLAAAATLPAGRVWAKPAVTATVPAAPESVVKLLYESLTPAQNEAICFAWDYVDPERGLLRTRVANNWHVTEQTLDDDFYSDDQRAMVREVMKGIYNPEWIDRIDKQLGDDSGGWESNSIAIFGKPGSDNCEFVMTGRHMTIRCDGNTTEHVAFGGPVFYGHDADGFDEGPMHPGNVYWPQAVAANGLYQMLDGEQQEAALVRKGMPREQRVGFQGAKGEFQGIPVAQLSADQKENLQGVLKKLVELYREIDRKEINECLNKQGGLDACHLAYYAQGDIGGDGVWDNWRLEGPSFVWHYRGAPHVHVWVNVADSPNVKLNVG